MMRISIIPEAGLSLNGVLCNCQITLYIPCHGSECLSSIHTFTWHTDSQQRRVGKVKRNVSGTIKSIVWV